MTTAGVTRRSPGEERLASYLLFCDRFTYFCLASTAIFAFGVVRLMGLSLELVTYSTLAKIAGVIIAYLAMSSRIPNSEIAPWIRRWTRTASILLALASAWVVVASDSTVLKVGAAVAGLFCLLLYRKVGSLAIAELDAWGPLSAQRMFGFGLFGPELDAWVTGFWLASAIVLRTAMPSVYGPGSVNVDDLKSRLLQVAIAEHRYHSAHGRYSSDLAELRALNPSVRDSLVRVTVDREGWRAVARDSRGSVSCGMWGGAPTLRIEGAQIGQTICWRGERPL